MMEDDILSGAAPWSRLVPAPRWGVLAERTVAAALEPAPRPRPSWIPKPAFAAAALLLALGASLGAWAAASPAFRERVAHAWHRLTGTPAPAPAAPRAVLPPQAAPPAKPAPGAKPHATAPEKDARAREAAERGRERRERDRERSRRLERLERRSRRGGGGHGRR